MAMLLYATRVCCVIGKCEKCPQSQTCSVRYQYQYHAVKSGVGWGMWVLVGNSLTFVVQLIQNSLAAVHQ